MIEAEELLRRLYRTILLPEAVAKELQAERTPETVKKWVQSPPQWVEIVPDRVDAQPTPISCPLGAGETSAILLALMMRADLLLIDERAGAEEARRLGLTVTGTLGILAECAALGWIGLRPVLERLLKTNFRVHPRLIEEMLLADAENQRG